MGWIDLLDANDNVIGIVGDEPWDMMSNTVNEIDNLYLRKFFRHVSRNEIEQILNFTYGPIEEANDG